MTLNLSITPVYPPTVNNFYCQSASFVVECLSLSQFSEAPFHTLCPSGSCLEDCQNLGRLYSVLPDGIDPTLSTFYGSPINVTTLVTLQGICLGYSNISRAISDSTIPESAASTIKPYFPSTGTVGLQNVTNAVTRCLINTCDQAHDPENCLNYCSAAYLLVDGVTPSVQGAFDCMQLALCSAFAGIPFANQDIVGIGVTISYVIQSILVILCWCGLTVIQPLVARIRRSQSDSHEAKKIFVESTSAFLQAQCYFSIPIAIAALLQDPFHKDPMNAFGLLPVATNGFLPQIFTLFILERFGRRSWYMTVLTLISYVLSSIVFWAIIIYLREKVEFGTRDFEFRSLNSIDSCGGSTAIALCSQVTGYNAIASLSVFPHSAIRNAPLVWIWSTIYFCFLLVKQFVNGTPSIKSRIQSRRQVHIKTVHNQFLQSLWDNLRSRTAGWLAYGVSSTLFLISLGFQAWIFRSYQSVDLVDLQGWTFGQIIALMVWIPPLLDYLHAQFKNRIDRFKHNQNPPKHDGNNRSLQDQPPLKPVDTSYHPVQPYDYGDRPDDQPGRNSTTNLTAAAAPPARPSYDASNEDTDDDSVSSAVEIRTHDDFEMRSLPLRMEDGHEGQPRASA